MSDKNHENAWASDSTVMAIVDVVLLGFIRAHPTKEDDGTRLRAAKKALFGIKAGPGKPPDYDLPELLAMASLFLEDRPGWSHDEDWAIALPEQTDDRTRSKTQLAKLALATRTKTDPAFSPHNEKEKIRNLEQKFEKNKDDLLRLVAGWSSPGRALDLQRRQMAEALTELGIPFFDVTDPNRDRNSVN